MSSKRRRQIAAATATAKKNEEERAKRKLKWKKLHPKTSDFMAKQKRVEKINNKKRGRDSNRDLYDDDYGTSKHNGISKPNFKELCEDRIPSGPKFRRSLSITNDPGYMEHKFGRKSRYFSPVSRSSIKKKRKENTSYLGIPKGKKSSVASASLQQKRSVVRKISSSDGISPATRRSDNRTKRNWNRQQSQQSFHKNNSDEYLPSRSRTRYGGRSRTKKNRKENNTAETAYDLCSPSEEDLCSSSEEESNKSPLTSGLETGSSDKEEENMVNANSEDSESFGNNLNVSKIRSKDDLQVSASPTKVGQFLRVVVDRAVLMNSRICKKCNIKSCYEKVQLAIAPSSIIFESICLGDDTARREIIIEDGDRDRCGQEYELPWKFISSASVNSVYKVIHFKFSGAEKCDDSLFSDFFTIGFEDLYLLCTSSSEEDDANFDAFELSIEKHSVPRHPLSFNDCKKIFKSLEEKVSTRNSTSSSSSGSDDTVAKDSLQSITNIAPTKRRKATPSSSRITKIKEDSTTSISMKSDDSLVPPSTPPIGRRSGRLRKKLRRQYDPGYDENKLYTVYAPESSVRETITLTHGDIDRLHEGEFLNDSVIDFYMRWIQVQNEEKEKNEVGATERGKKKTAHVFNTFFFKKLLQGGHDGVKRWTRKVDIFSLDFLFIPVNMSFHWSLAIVCNPGRFEKAPSLDEELNDYSHDERAFCIILLDSLSCHKISTVTKEIWNYMEIELYTRKKKEPALKFQDCFRSKIDCPRQNNSCDCGVYVCKNVEILLTNLTKLDVALKRISRAVKDGNYTRKNLRSKFKCAITKEHYNPKDISKLRLSMKSTLAQLKQQNDILAKVKEQKEAEKAKEKASKKVKKEYKTYL
eukprot:g97.t1